MSTPHIAAEKGQIAERILLPGDPLRAKFIAENFLEDAKEYTHVRGILGYTGTYKGVPVSVQGTGMGMPSISIYVHELINEYGCNKLIRVGTCGGIRLDLREAAITEDEEIDIHTFCGGIELFVPTTVNVEVKSRSFIGGVGNHATHTANPKAPTIHIIASNFLGGVDIKN